ncbi:MAG: NAD(P)H-binding protein [Streptosporangiales bacterium]
MRIFVAGGTGVIGQHLLPRLAAGGHQVTASTRNAARAGQLRALGAEPVILDGLDGPAVGAAVAAAHHRPRAGRPAAGRPGRDAPRPGPRGPPGGG